MFVMQTVDDRLFDHIILNEHLARLADQPYNTPIDVERVEAKEKDCEF